MNLTIYRPATDEVVLENPTQEDIARAVESMGDEECLVLSLDEETFIQAVSTRDQALVIEHQEGGTENFFVAKDEMTPKLVIKAMQDYLMGGDAWQQDLNWEKVNLLAYLNPDFTMLTYVSAETLAAGGMIDFEEFYEMPHIGVHQIIMLYQLLCGGEYEDLEEQFDILGEADMDDDLQALLYVAPEPFFLALESLEASALPELAQKWWESEYFPQSVAHVDDVVELLKEISEIARNSAANSSVLIVCEVGSGEDD